MQRPLGTRDSFFPARSSSALSYRSIPATCPLLPSDSIPHANPMLKRSCRSSAKNATHRGTVPKKLASLFRFPALHLI